jgi:superfamily II DNA or RNA helicase
MDILPYSYQQEILDKLEAERKVRGYNHNLVVAATGTGKTVISALDYKRFRKQNPSKPCRLLFVAHREEILKQSLYTFRAVLKDANFGEMFVGNYKPDSIDNLFISIQTFNSQDFTAKTTPDFYDYIIVDEFHHAAAPTYQKLLAYYQPQLLLGLTATPERMDGKSILPYFNNRIAAEIRLPEAIDRKLLCPFQYFGVTDTVDLDTLKWSAGGYDKGELSRIYTLSGFAAKRRADLVINSLLKYVTDINDVKGLGFCVSIEHAEFMSRHFNEHNIPSMFLTGQSPDEERKAAKQRLVAGEVRFIFVVDIYNEGVDIPEVNTVLFLRPTESLTVFLQQLGRGLRLAEGKECLTVLDFIGQAHKKYNFEDKFAALLSNTTRSVTREIKDGFVSVPKGCYIQLEKLAAKYIMDNIRASYGNTAGLVSRVASFEEDSGLTLTLKNFLDYYHLDPRSIYKFSSFSRICARADAIEDFDEPIEDTLTKAFARLSVIDSRRWISFLLDILPKLSNVNLTSLTPVEQRMLQMFYITVWGKAAESWDNEEALSNLQALSNSPTLIGELTSLLQYQYERIDFIDEPVNLGFDCPLDLHCTYTRDQLLVAMDFMKPATVREGVKWLPEKQLDVFFVTLNKSDKDYSPTTMYNDYSINETLFHWQSQSTTNATGNVGQRYINHKKRGSKVLLFVREFKSDRIIPNGVGAYTFLGTANYVTHSGSRPMNITWKLDRPIPAKYLKKTNKMVVG